MPFPCFLISSFGCTSIGLLPRARRRCASGGGRRRGVDRAHLAGQTPQLGAAGRDSHQDTETQDQHFLVDPCRAMCSRWPTSELPPTCGCDGGVVQTDHHNAGERSGSTQHQLRPEGSPPSMHLLVAGKAHHKSGTFHSRHIGVSKGKLHI
jgi:hypothetical protein